MGSQLPPLKALRAFEVVARLKSVTQAAKELNVTHSAVSQQLKLLESYLNIALLERRAGRIALTVAGSAYSKELHDIFSNLKQATERLLYKERPNVLSIRFTTSLAMRWLIPRLADFQEMYPDIELQLTTGPSKVVNFAIEPFDLVIYFGRSALADLHHDLLFKDELFPVCSAALLENDFAAPDVSSFRKYLQQHKLILVASGWMGNDWQLWLDSLGLTMPGEASTIALQNYSLAIQAALNGVGIAMGHRALVMDDIRAGNLVIPYQHKVITEYNYYLVCPKAYLRKHKVSLFRKWILNEIAN